MALNRGRIYETGCVSLPPGMVCSLKVRAKGILYLPTFSFRTINTTICSLQLQGISDFNKEDGILLFPRVVFVTLKKNHINTSTDWMTVTVQNKPLESSFT